MRRTFYKAAKMRWSEGGAELVGGIHRDESRWTRNDPKPAHQADKKGAPSGAPFSCFD
jgi:hypothetical protein